VQNQHRKVLAAGWAKLPDMAETASTESVPARLAEIREQLKLLADYL
jgi:hypothetical protein